MNDSQDYCIFKFPEENFDYDSENKPSEESNIQELEEATQQQQNNVVPYLRPSARNKYYCELSSDEEELSDDSRLDPTFDPTEHNLFALDEIPIPNSYEEAINSKNPEYWIEAMQREMNSLQEHQTAFLYGKLDEDIYLLPPQGYQPTDENLVYTFHEIPTERIAALSDGFKFALRTLKRNGSITPEQFQRFTSNLTGVPYIYGLPKTHKPHIPLRPIVAYHLSPALHLAKYLTNLLKPLVKAHNLFSVQDSTEFLTKLKSIPQPDKLIMSTFDVTSLFLCLPHSLITDGLSSLLAFSTFSSKDQKSIIDLFTICLGMNTLEFNSRSFLQIRGSPMGSPLSTIAAEIVMLGLDQWLVLRFGFRVIAIDPCLRSQDITDFPVRRVDRIVDAKGREEDPKEPMESDPDSESGENTTFPKKETTLGRTQEVPPNHEDVTPPPPVSDVLGRLTRTLHQLSAVTGLSREVESLRWFVRGAELLHQLRRPSRSGPTTILYKTEKASKPPASTPPSYQHASESLIKNLLTENADIPEAIDENQEDSSILETTFVIEDEESNKDIGTPKIEISEVSVIDKSEGKYSKEPVVSVEALDKKELCHDDSAHLNVVEADLNRPKEATSGIINVYTEANESSSKEKVVPVEIVDTSTKDYLQSGEKAKLSRWKPIDSLCLEYVKESEDDDENYSSSAYIEWPEILKKEVLRPEALEKAVNLEDFEKAAESRQLSKEHLEESTEQGSCIKAESKTWEDPIESDLAAAESDNPACMDIKNVRKWCREFNEGRINVHDEQRSGRPSLPESTVARIDEMVRANRRITLEEIEDGLDEDCSHFSKNTLGDRSLRQTTR
ncbi:hypothetical protein LAZ67_8001163 [Cordylochernes scorpioides]|uniref:Reverse transcriptase domain-containing protein n=1 Tax=Cordylochernes scorpioides TaxID=51811 RepID=A0ABY6KPY4_9ARAC|nr:hypothetical protein LAZ67_8001163 [Cordylochernes scorpioides]